MKNPDAVAAYRAPVLARLESFIKERRQKLPVGLAWQADILERLQDFAGGGKLLRGSLVCYSYAVCSDNAAGDGQANDLPTAVLDTAAALELIHAGLLIHDDIIDQDDLRRGRPAMHRQYRDLAAIKGLPGAARLSENLALCAGDMILFLAFELLATIQLRNDNGPALAELFGRELMTVCAGQMQDIYLGALDKPPAKRDIYAVMQAKTAAYSVALPLAAGAVLAGRPASIRQQLYNIGLAAGIMFQVRDDELGALGRSSDIGKPVGSDIREGKKTLLYYYLWKAAKPVERRRLATMFGNPDASPADIREVQQALRRHGVPARLQADIQQLEQTAGRLITKLELNTPAKAELRRLVRFCAARKL